ncbi:MAG TPA: hypothetical protein VGD31_17755 [Sphingobacteriaceae bacterium]
MKTILLSIIAIVLLASCNDISKLRGHSYLELDGHSLTIKNFNWGYGKVRVNELHGDFKDIDKKVYQQLKGESGIYSIYISNATKDQYGNDQEESKYIGDIDATELSKYQSWEYWHEHSGTRPLLVNTFIKTNENASLTSQVTSSNIVAPMRRDPLADMPARDLSIPDDGPVADSVGAPGELYRWNSKTRQHELISSPKSRSLILTQTDLYPDPEERADQDYQGYTQQIKGIIKAADFYNGTLEVQADDYYALRVEPVNLPTSLKSELRYYLKPGNRISVVCTRAGARELIIVSGTFSSR